MSNIQIFTWVGAALGCLLLGGYLIFFGVKRPEVLDLSIAAHVTAPSVKRLELNGRIVMERRTKPLSEGGPATYASRRDDTLRFSLKWYDIIEQRAYTTSFELPANALSTFGEVGKVARMRIQTGPGADVTVFTPHPEALRLIGLRQMDKITPDMDEDIELQALCGQELSADDPAAMHLKQAIETWSLEPAMAARDRFLAANPVPVSRCTGKE